MKEYLWLIVSVVVFVVVVTIGPYIWWQNYKECRAAGFSVMYCGTRK